MKPWEQYGEQTEGSQGPWEKFTPQETNSLEGKSFLDLTPEDKANISRGAREQVGGAIVGAADARSLGFGDEIGAALGTAVAYPLQEQLGLYGRGLETVGLGDTQAGRYLNSRPSLPAGEIYSNILNRSRTMDAQIEQRDPNAYLAGQVIGGVTGGKAIGEAWPQLATVVRDGQVFGRNLGLAGRAAKAGAATSLGMGAYGAGSGEGIDDRIDQGVTGLATGGALGAIFPLAGAVGLATVKGGKNVAKGAFARNADKIEKAGDALYDASSQSYKYVRDSGATFSPQSSSNIINSIESELVSDGPLNKGLHGATISLVEDLKAASGKPDFSLEQLDQYRRLFNRLPRTNPEDVRKASIVIDAIDDAVNKVGANDLTQGSREAIEALTQARKQYSQASKFDNVATIIEQSGGDANKLKSSLQRFANNPKKTRGWNSEELKALDEAAKNTTGEGLLKLAGKFGVDLGSSLSVGNAALPAITAITTGATSGFGPAALAVGGGTVARQAQKYVARAKADDLLKIIERGGKVSAQQINELSPTEGSKLLQSLNSQRLGKGAGIAAQNRN